ncbi:MAG TPA: hypothetical protein K8U88_00780 [Levilactobacillus hammesii]|uniref:Uncharacterized protein n=1 Tax=Levilactobacillus hammesii TaxID=267633 RepID=A0A921JVS7_9LACO|nr:hypothetical protein [Levilactobacillus hammesii]
MMIDHTFVFPKMIWMFASVVLLFFRYSPVVLGLSYVVIYLLYVFVSLVNYVSVERLLLRFPDELRFYRNIRWVVWSLPLYNFFVSWIRLVGVINSMSLPGVWNTSTFAAEARAAKHVVGKDAHYLRQKKGSEWNS